MSDYLPNEERYSQMHYRRSGQSGLKLPRISLGLPLPKPSPWSRNSFVG